MTGGRKIAVFVVDDHAVVREGLHAVLAVRGEFEVVGEAAGGEEAIAGYRRLRPDVTVIDLRMPGIDGIQTIRALRKIDPSARILAITSFPGDVDVKRALDAGAIGFIRKGASGREVVEAVRRVAAGQASVATDALDDLLHANAFAALTSREIEVLGLIAEGLRNHEIAGRLGLSLSTIKVHVNRILEKLDAQDRTEAVITALKRGIIRLP